MLQPPCPLTQQLRWHTWRTLLRLLLNLPRASFGIEQHHELAHRSWTDYSPHSTPVLLLSHPLRPLVLQSLGTPPPPPPRRRRVPRRALPSSEPSVPCRWLWSLADLAEAVELLSPPGFGNYCSRYEHWHPLVQRPGNTRAPPLHETPRWTPARSIGIPGSNNLLLRLPGSLPSWVKMLIVKKGGLCPWFPDRETIAALSFSINER
ncbi:hypothetical protein JOL62DRAFT_15650 [Phyllosticta paracitricarpa]|uniref:Uncharacterized protein n=1 Tax=Phyllosticta paracitricarpa TaxID=2016321 RepID=A0ABR1NAN4_9PEZI